MPPSRDPAAFHIRRAEAERHAASLATDAGTRLLHQEMALRHEVARYSAPTKNERRDEEQIGATLRGIFSLR